MPERDLAIKLDSGGDIPLVTRAGGGVDLPLTSGADAFDQTVRIHLLTRLGEDPISPFIGLPVPQIIGVFNADFIAGSIRRALIKDPRIAAVDVDLVKYDRERREGTFRVAVRKTTGEALTTTLTFGGA